MNILLTKSSKWKASDLDQQRIEFLILLEGGPHEGLGTLSATECPDDLLSISIVCDLPAREHSETRIHIPIPQSGTDALEIHPNQTVARFRLCQ
jgi:hypothetical protein